MNSPYSSMAIDGDKRRCQRSEFECRTMPLFRNCFAGAHRRTIESLLSPSLVFWMGNPNDCDSREAVQSDVLSQWFGLAARQCPDRIRRHVIAGQTISIAYHVRTVRSFHFHGIASLARAHLWISRGNRERADSYPVAMSPAGRGLQEPFFSCFNPAWDCRLRAKESRIYLNYPALPEAYPLVRIRNVQIGNASVDLEFEDMQRPSR